MQENIMIDKFRFRIWCWNRIDKDVCYVSCMNLTCENQPDFHLSSHTSCQFFRKYSTLLQNISCPSSIPWIYIDWCCSSQKEISLLELRDIAVLGIQKYGRKGEMLFVGCPLALYYYIDLHLTSMLQSTRIATLNWSRRLLKKKSKIRVTLCHHGAVLQ